MLHTCVQKFNVTGNVEIFLGKFQSEYNKLLAHFWTRVPALVPDWDPTVQIGELQQHHVQQEIRPPEIRRGRDQGVILLDRLLQASSHSFSRGWPVMTTWMGGATAVWLKYLVIRVLVLVEMDHILWDEQIIMQDVSTASVWDDVEFDQRLEMLFLMCP